MTIPWWSGLLAFALGVLGGKWWFSTQNVVHAANRVEKPPVSVSPTPHPVVQAVASSQVAASPTDAVPVGGRLKYISALNARLNQKLTPSLLIFDTVNPDFATIFELSPEEVSRITDAVASAKHRLAELEASHATITPKDNGGWSISVPPFPEEGGQVYTEFQGVVRDTLGTERFAAYKQMNGAVAHEFSTLGDFGLNNTLIEVRPPGGDQTSSGQWNTDQATGLTTVRTNASLEFIRDRRPELYRKLAAQTGFVAPPKR